MSIGADGWKDVAVKTENARIKSVSLGIEDHDILTAFLYLDFGSSSQGFGGYALDASGANYCAAFIRGVLDVVGAREWSDLPETIIRVRHDDAPGCARTIKAIGHAIDNRWFDPSEALSKMAGVK